MQVSYVNPYKLWHGAFVPNWLLEMPGVSHGAKLVYAKLCQYADKDTGIAWPKMDTLAESVGIKERQCREYVKELEKLGFIESKRLGLGQTNQYRFVHTVHMGAPTAEPDRRDSADQQRQDSADPLYKDGKDSTDKIQSSRSQEPGVLFFSVPIPEDLAKHSESLSLWEQYKRDRKEPYKSPVGIKAFFGHIRNLPDVPAAVAYSMAMGYQGVYPPKDAKANPQPQTVGGASKRVRTKEELEAAR